MKCVPRIDSHYWVAIVLASIFGANVGDFVSDNLGLGHLKGVPYLAIVFAIILIIEALVKFRSALFYWAAIITVRAAATNIGDAFRDFGLHFDVSIPLTLVVLQIGITTAVLKRNNTTNSNSIPVNALYWPTMFAAGVLGTLVGDYCSFGLRLGPPIATILLGAALGAMLFFGRKGLLTATFYFWMTIAMVRSAGTAAGDTLAHGFGLALSTAITGIVFAAVILLFYTRSKDHLVIKGINIQSGLAG